MGNALGAAAVDGEYPVPLLDAAVPVGQAARNNLVHLGQHQPLAQGHAEQ